MPPVAASADDDLFCLTCDYNLRGLTVHRCPECGTPFDPAALAVRSVPWGPLVWESAEPRRRLARVARTRPRTRPRRQTLTPAMHQPAPLQCLARCIGQADHPRSWKGLSPEDRALFRAHLQAETFATGPIYFHIPCGTAPAAALDFSRQTGIPGQHQLYFKRCDLVANIDGRWHVLELKPAAGYVALGQALSYHALLCAAHPELRSARPGVLTDAADPDLLPVYTALHVRLFGLADSTYEPLGRPT